MGDKVDKALNDLMTVEHIMSNAQCILAEYINDLQDRTEALEAEVQQLREALVLALQSAPLCNCWKSKVLEQTKAEN